MSLPARQRRALCATRRIDRAHSPGLGVQLVVTLAYDASVEMVQPWHAACCDRRTHIVPSSFFADVVTDG